MGQKYKAVVVTLPGVEPMQVQNAEVTLTDSGILIIEDPDENRRLVVAPGHWGGYVGLGPLKE